MSQLQPSSDQSGVGSATTDPDVPAPPIDPDPPLPVPDPDQPQPGPAAEPTHGFANETLDDPVQPGLASAGEGGQATSDVPSPQTGVGADIIIGEIPDAHDLSHMRWTARCSDASHDLVGYYDSRTEAEQAGGEHLSAQHRAG